MSNMGLVMGTRSSSSLFQPALIKIQLNLHCSIVNPIDGEVYTLVIFTNDHPKLVQRIRFEHANETMSATPFVLRVIPNVASMIHLWLYADVRDEDNLLTQLCLAWGSCELSKITHEQEVLLVDIYDQCQAKVQLEFDVNHQVIQYLQQHAKSPPSQQQLSISQRIQNQVMSVYQTLQHDSDQYFVYVKTGSLQLPLITFPILATRISYTNHSAVQWFTQLLSIAKHELNQSIINATITPFEICCELIGEMVTLPLRGQMYINDYARERMGHTITRKPCDQWSRLNCYPDIGRVGFDCEDGAHFILELLWVLRQIQVGNNMELQHLQNVLRCYTPCLAIGKIRIDKQYSPHAFVVLLDNNAFERGIKGEGYGRPRMKPGMIIESTNYLQSVWAKLDSKYNSNFDRGEAMLDQCDTDKWKRILHNKADHESIVQDSLYGPVSALLTSSNECAYHVLCRTKRGQIGVELNELLNYSPTVQFHVATHVHSKDINEIMKIAAELPISVLPSPTPASIWNVEYRQYITIRPTKKSNCVRYFMRSLDYEENDKEFEKLLKANGYGVHEVVNIHIAEHIEISVAHCVFN